MEVVTFKGRQQPPRKIVRPGPRQPGLIGVLHRECLVDAPFNRLVQPISYIAVGFKAAMCYAHGPTPNWEAVLPQPANDKE